MRAARNHFFDVLLGFFLVVVPAQAQFTVYTNEAAFLGAINAGYYREPISQPIYVELTNNRLPPSRDFASNGFGYQLSSPEAPAANGGLTPLGLGSWLDANTDFVIFATFPRLGLLFTNFSSNVSAVGGNFFALGYNDKFTNTPVSITATLVNGAIFETNYSPGGVNSYLGLAFSGQSIASLRILNASNSPTEEYITINNFTAGTIGKTNASVVLGNLLQTFNGAARPATATSIPSGLAVALTYNGSSAAPTNAGTYNVVATINDANYQGNASDTLTISKATASIALGALSQTYDGSTKSTTATTTPEGLTVDVTYNGNAQAPTSAGTYAVAATINDANYQGSTSATLSVAKASAGVVLGNLSQTYNGSARSATATTTPVGLAVDLTYNGSSLAPTNAGTYNVVATIIDSNYEGRAGGNLVIADSAYQTWASDNSLNGVDADPSADPDKDGWSNALEFAFGLVPTSAGGQLLAVSGSGKKITFLQRSGVTYVVHSTTNLAAGFTGMITPEKSIPQPAGLPSGYEQFEALFPSNSPRGFSKIEVMVQP